MKENPETESGSKILERKAGFFLIGFFGLYLLMFLLLSPFSFLDGDDAMEAIYALCKQKGIDPFQFPLHGYLSRSGTFALIYIFSLLFGNPRIVFATLTAASAALSLALLPLYASQMLGIRPKAIHWLLVFCAVPEIVYAGLYPNAAILGYSLGFLALVLSLRLILAGKNKLPFVLSGACFGAALACSMSAGYLALVFPLQHFFFRSNRGMGQVLFNFSMETVAGAAVYAGALALMGLGPLAPFREFSEVANTYSAFLANYALITFLGAFTPTAVLALLAGLIFMLKDRKWPALIIGLLVFMFFPALLLSAINIKSFQHALAMYLLMGLAVVQVWERLTKPLVRGAYSALLLLPLIFGLRLYLPEQPHRGPGFSELDPGRALSLAEKDRQGLGGFKLWQSPEIKIRGRGLRLALGSGFMLPTNDGGRALGGLLWAWTMDWKPYLDSINRSYRVIMASGENDLVMGQFPVAAITMHNLIADGYRPVQVQFRDFYFEKAGRVIRNYWYFNLMLQFVGKIEIRLEPLPESVKQGVLVTYPSFAFQLESGRMKLKDFSLESLGDSCFRISRIK